MSADPKTELNAAESATLQALTTTLRTCNAHLGGSAIGTGFRHAARYHLRKRAPGFIAEKRLNDTTDANNNSRCSSPALITPAALSNDVNYDTSVLEPGCTSMIEDPFYVVDLGIVASQLARWRAAFPRVLPYYAVKCNPDPVIVQTLASLGCNFDCASRGEIEIVQRISRDLPEEIGKPDIIFANPCKGRGHVIDAVCRGVKCMTFDNVAEIYKCASVSKRIQLILRIITDDSGSQCRLSSKFGAPKQHWKELLGEAKKAGLEVVGVSFHVGSGCRDATRYEMALRDAKELFEMAEREFGFKMNILDIGGGFPGETHSLWNPATAFGDPTADMRGHRRKPTMMQDIPTIREGGFDDEDPLSDDEEEDDEIEGNDPKESAEEKEKQFMYFNEIAAAVAPMLDEMFPASSGVKIIAEPGRYLVAASATLVASVVSVRNNLTDKTVKAEGISDKTAASNVFLVTRDEEDEIVQETAQALKREDNSIMDTLVEELTDYSVRYARANLSQQEVDVYLDNIKPSDTEDILAEALDVVAEEETETNEDDAVEMTHTVEGMQAGIVVGCADVFDDDASAISSRRSRAESFDGSKMSEGNALDIPFVLAAAGEAAVSGIVRQAIADSVQPLQDDFAYYINDGVYGAFNNLLFDHATVRPRKLRHALSSKHQIVEVVHGEGKDALRTLEVVDEADDEKHMQQDETLYPSTVFGPTCDSMDVLSRGVLLPKMDVGDWMYFQNMGAYTSAAASTFNGFPTTEKFYVCSVPSHHFKKLVVDGRVNVNDTEGSEEKKDDA